MAAEKTTPMMQQYREAKRELPPGTLLLFRLGDFFELFEEDAVEASRLLGLTLTRRQEVPMAGLPAHAVDAYAAKLLAAGRRVALCDQLEPAVPGKLVKRALTRILSPGTALDPAQLEPGAHRWLAAVDLDGRGLHAAWLDLTSGEFVVASDASAADLVAVLNALSPAEVLVPEGEAGAWAAREPAVGAWLRGRRTAELPAYHFERGAGVAVVKRALGVLTLDGFGVPDGHGGLGPAGAVVHYATEALRAPPGNLVSVAVHRRGRTLLLDPATQRNLEILRSVRGTREGSLLEVLDATVTPAGARLVEAWLAAPTLDLEEVRRRQALVGAFAARPAVLAEVRVELGGVRDLARIVGRLQNRLRSPRELAGVRDTVVRLPALAAKLAAVPGAPVLPEFPALEAELVRALADEVPAAIEDGGSFRPGFDAELDRLRGLGRGHKEWLTELERREQARTGIRSLKVRYNANFGYFIEVTKPNLHLVPAEYHRRQTTVGGERFTTDELREREREILTADERALARERELFTGLVAAVLVEAASLLAVAAVLAEVDVLAGWAVRARESGWVKPEVDDGDVVAVTEGRHPVVEAVLRAERERTGAGEAFVPNDVELASDDQQIVLLTGPNMAGKSTYIRQVALLVLMAQVGSWVPAKAARVGWVDRIFSRIGASDDLARGNSTFMVEMSETANILHHATERSLVVLDEIGRGTSTYDGLAIAWAVVEHLHGTGPRGPRTLFATHYQELTQLAGTLPRLRNHSVAVKEWNDEVIFVRRVVPGPADRSYGIQVARLAGIPAPVVARAREILDRLEGGGGVIEEPAVARAVPRRKPAVRGEEAAEGQLGLF